MVAENMVTDKSSGELVRALNWKGAFWVAAGVPPLVLFSIGGIAGVAGKAAFVVWIISMIMGFLQSFTRSLRRTRRWCWTGWRQTFQR
jgi:hypothetical protein